MQIERNVLYFLKIRYAFNNSLHYSICAHTYVYVCMYIYIYCRLISKSVIALNDFLLILVHYFESLSSILE